MSNNDDNREQRRRFSSLQRKFGGGLKKKVTSKPIESPKAQPAFQFPKLKRGARRPSYEQTRETDRLQLIPEETESRVEDLSDDYRDAEETTERTSSSTSVEQVVVESRRKSKSSLPASPESVQLPSPENNGKKISEQSEEDGKDFDVEEKEQEQPGEQGSRRTSYGSWQRAPVSPESRKESSESNAEPEVPRGKSARNSSVSWHTAEMFEDESDHEKSRKNSGVVESRRQSSSNKASRKASPRTLGSEKNTPESDVTLKSLPFSEYGIRQSPKSQQGRPLSADVKTLTPSSQQSPDKYSLQQETGNIKPHSNGSGADGKIVRSKSRNSVTVERKMTSSRRTSRRSSRKSGIVGKVTDDFDSPLPPPPTGSSPSPPSRVREAAFSIPESETSKKSRRFSRYLVLEEEDDEESGYVPEKRNSVQFPVLADREKEFHELVAAGDVEAVEQFLGENVSFNVNCVSYEKTSALKMAIRDLNEPMVTLLLSREDINVCDAVLTAVKTGHLGMLETVLTCLETSHPGLEFAPCPFSSDFPEDLTPLMLAAQEGKFEIVDVLLNRGHRMPDIHQPFCTCRKCKEDVRKYDYLKYSTMKLNQYKAIASPMYFFQTTSDPIRRAFELTGELQAAARMFPQFHSDYEEMWKHLRAFSSEFIGCCRNSEEVELILNQPAGCDAASALFFPRLQFAIDTNQKEFVAHPFVQAVLESVWTGEAKDWKTKSALNQALAPFLRIPVLFFAFALSCCLPTHGILKKFHAPVNKFISSFAGYIIFLTMIFSVSAEGKMYQKRGPPTSFLKWPIVFFVAGYVWNSFRLCFQLGPKRFFSIGWNWFDVLMQLCFIFVFIFWIAAWADVMAYDDESLPRRYWNAWDPTLIAEGLFVIATIMAFLRLFLPLSLNYYLGPLQVSIGKMMLDVTRFVLIFGLLIFAWTAGLCHLYEPYAGMVQTDPATGDKTSQVDSFVNFSMTLKTFFWALFGMTGIEAADVIIENPEGTASTVINQHVFTQGVGYFAFAIFSFFAVIVVLNMLVACMANTFTKVIDNIPVEWVFGRTKVYIIYMYHGVFPSPLNLFPKMDDITTALTYLSLIPKKRAKCSLTHCCYIERAEGTYPEKDFHRLMSDLAQRYICLKKTEEGGTNDHDEEQKKIV